MTDKKRNVLIAFLLGLTPGLGWLYTGYAWYVYFVSNIIAFWVGGYIERFDPLLYFAPLVISGFMCAYDAKQINEGKKDFEGVSRLFIPLGIISAFAIGLIVGIELMLI